MLIWLYAIICYLCLNGVAFFSVIFGTTIPISFHILILCGSKLKFTSMPTQSSYVAIVIDFYILSSMSLPRAVDPVASRQ